jgi:oxygen-independent coproporphyrinogen-3 oxidase
MSTFIDRVLAEAALWTSAATSAARPAIRPRTVFFGGGTPSLLPLEEMRRLIDGLRQRFDFSLLDEWTVEANPATVSLEYCAMLRECGVDRLSFGAQSFDKAQLAILERHHDPHDVTDSIDMARRAGFGRLNVDLIYAIPGQDLESWQSTLEQAISLGLSHYSCYGLTYEPNTPITVRKRMGRFEASDEGLELAMMRHARQRLGQIGCPAYEISNYAAPGQDCRHNLLYWTGGNYVGLGPSAASHIEGHRFKNLPHLGEWEQAIDRGELPASDVEVLTPRQRAGEVIMLGLRLTRGVSYSEFAARTGFDATRIFDAQIARLTRLGLLESDNSGFRLSEEGLAVTDGIAAEFLEG